MVCDGGGGDVTLVMVMMMVVVGKAPTQYVVEMS